MPESALMNTYGRLPIQFHRGDRIWLYDDQERKYLDTTSSIAVCGLGHNHPAVTSAIQQQVTTLCYTSNHYQSPYQEQLATVLTGISNTDQAFFCNSGAEANETAIKLARLHGRRMGLEHPSIIVMNSACHGRTIATLTASGQRASQAGFEPLSPGFIRAPFNDLHAIEQIAKSNHNVSAVLIEPIQGEAGIHLPDESYLAELRKICDEHGWLLMFDEVQTGNGRTGSYFYAQKANIQPDVITTAKGLGNGFPIGVCLAKEQTAELFTPGSHSSTFGGNPMACAAALAVIETIQTHKLCERASILGNLILDSLHEELTGSHYIKNIRGCGLMIGIELTEPCPELVAIAKATGLLINITGNQQVIRLLPPLIMSNQEASKMTNKLIKLIKIYMGDERSAPRRPH
ncbi:aspartate aminotransferase family protein [Litoribacillus peritrichatus]|uniref:Aspartate aminotransferase family protein n=1 Tax=Litoribacillus peritrichatus TaxID=718191 RepID=A0ABP7MIJ0_9GAMM